FYEATQITELHKVKVVFFDVKGAESSTLTAQRGTYRWQDGSMEAKGSVLVVSPDGRRLATSVLRYENATNLIMTDQHFTFDRGEEHLEGNSFRSDPDFKNVVTDRPRGVTGNGMLLPGQ
ncbi:MAG TPA: LPS export ABC transporter periplasmic protein LptC, partial [Gemmatimonadales bacterium]|nr:LPS export ABC transporter periplasmic protein LptC [Gemmatimonadales bacterium]